MFVLQIHSRQISALVESDFPAQIFVYAAFYLNLFMKVKEFRCLQLCVVLIII